MKMIRMTITIEIRKRVSTVWDFGCSCFLALKNTSFLRLMDVKLFCLIVSVRRGYELVRFVLIIFTDSGWLELSSFGFSGLGLMGFLGSSFTFS